MQPSQKGKSAKEASATDRFFCEHERDFFSAGLRGEYVFLRIGNCIRLGKFASAE
jgi:hypothetical protein